MCPYLSRTIAVLDTTSGCLVHWTRTTLSDRNPFSPFTLFTSSLVTNFSWYNSDSTVWYSSTDTQTGHTKYCYTMLIPKVYNVCGYTVTAEGAVVIVLSGRKHTSVLNTYQSIKWPWVPKGDWLRCVTMILCKVQSGDEWEVRWQWCYWVGWEVRWQWGYWVEWEVTS